MRTFRVAFATIIMSLSAARESAAQVGRPSLESLATSWSGSAKAPECTAEKHMWSPTLVVGEECVWRRSDHTWAPYELGGHRRVGEALRALMWYRDVSDTIAGLAFRDSVDQAFSKYALARHICADSVRFWHAAGFYVLYTLGARQRNGALGVSLIVTTEPDPIIDLVRVFCHGIKVLPPSDAVRRSRIGALRRERSSLVSGVGV